MKCALQGCTGEYHDGQIAQVFTRNGQTVVVENIPARVCDVCGDTILSWQTVEQLFRILDAKGESTRYLPAYSFEPALA